MMGTKSPKGGRSAAMSDPPICWRPDKGITRCGKQGGGRRMRAGSAGHRLPRLGGIVGHHGTGNAWIVDEDLPRGGLVLKVVQRPKAVAEVPLQELEMSDVEDLRSEEHTSELQSLMRISYAVFCLKKKTRNSNKKTNKKM